MGFSTEKQPIFNNDVASLIIGFELFLRIPGDAKTLTLVPPKKPWNEEKKIRRKISKLPRANWAVNNEVVSEKNSGGKSFMKKLKQ